MAETALRRVAKKRIAETLGNKYAQSAVATDVIDAFAASLARGCLVVVDSRSRIVYFRNACVSKAAGK